jgi:N-acetylglucosamine-6-phosphate deacetylase
VLPAIGHTNATYEQTMAAINAGASYATHLFNAMRHLHQREPGATGALLLANEVMAEMIADGKHLHAALYEIAYRVKGKERLLLVTDAMRAKCMSDGCYELGGQKVHVTDGKATLANGTLAGSVLCMPDAIKNIMKYTDCSLEDAIRMASYNPAHKLNLTSRKGSIEVGKDADLVVLSDKLNVKLTMVGGVVVFEKVNASA